MYEELKELKELLDMGAITQEEFDAKKTELLSVTFSEKDLTNPAVPSSTSNSLTQQKSKMAAPPITSDTVTQNNKFATRFKKTLLAMLAVCLLCALCITSCAGILGSSNNSSSSSSSAAYDEDDEGYDDDDDYSSHSSSSSSTLLDEDDWVDTDDGKTYLKSFIKMPMELEQLLTARATKPWIAMETESSIPIQPIMEKLGAASNDTAIFIARLGKR